MLTLRGTLLLFLGTLQRLGSATSGVVVLGPRVPQGRGCPRVHDTAKGVCVLLISLSLRLSVLPLMTSMPD